MVSSLRAAPEALLEWWLQELALLSLGQAEKGLQPWRALLLADAAGFDVFLRRGQRTWHAGRLDTTLPPNEIEKVIAAIRSARVPPSRLLLRLHPGEVVTSELSLPTGAIDVLDHVVRNQLERIAPWPADQALFDYEVADPPAGSAGAGSMRVTVRVTGRSLVDRKLAQLRAFGLACTPGMIDAGDGPEAVQRHSLAVTSDVGHGRRRRAIGRALAALTAVALLSGVAGGTWAYMLRAELAETEAVTAREIAAASAALPRDTRVARQRAFIVEQRNARPPLAVTFETLSRVVPDDAYLERLELRDNTLTITGRARRAATLIAPIEASPQLSAVEFTAPTTRRDAEDLEDFSLKMVVEPPSVGSSPVRPESKR